MPVKNDNPLIIFNNHISITGNLYFRVIFTCTHQQIAVVNIYYTVHLDLTRSTFIFHV